MSQQRSQAFAVNPSYDSGQSASNISLPTTLSFGKGNSTNKNGAPQHPSPVLELGCLVWWQERITQRAQSLLN